MAAIFNENVLSELLNEGSINLNANPLNIKGVTMVIVHTNEGNNIPHFHIKRSGKHDCCIMLNENRFFNHGNNDSVLNKKEMKELDRWLREINITRNRTNFESLCDMWNESNHTTRANYDRDFDYTNIMQYK